MTPYILKVLLTAALVVAVSEVSKRSSLLGGLLASLPLVSFLAMIWLYLDTKDAGRLRPFQTAFSGSCCRLSSSSSRCRHS